MAYSLPCVRPSKRKPSRVENIFAHPVCDRLIWLSALWLAPSGRRSEHGRKGTISELRLHRPRPPSLAKLRPHLSVLKHRGLVPRQKHILLRLAPPFSTLPSGRKSLGDRASAEHLGSPASDRGVFIAFWCGRLWLISFASLGQCRWQLRHARFAGVLPSEMLAALSSSEDRVALHRRGRRGALRSHESIRRALAERQHRLRRAYVAWPWHIKRTSARSLASSHLRCTAECLLRRSSQWFQRGPGTERTCEHGP